MAAADFDVLPSSSYAVFSPAASRSTPVEELGGGDALIDEDDGDDDTDDSDDDEEEERLDIIDEVLMQNLTDDMYDPLSRSLSCPASSGTESEYASLVPFVDQDVPPFPISDEPASPASRTASGSAIHGTDPVPQRLALPPDPHGRRPESSSTGGTTRTSIRSRSLPFAYVETARCSLGTETRTGSETVDVRAITPMPQVTSSTTTQRREADIPLHVRSLSSDNDDDE